MGTPEKCWEKAKFLPNYIEFTGIEPYDLNKIFSTGDDHFVYMLKNIFSLDPTKRQKKKKKIS